MDKKMISALGGASALALLGGGAAMAAPAEGAQALQPARSFGELLDPIPNAVSVLKADDARAATAKVELAQFYEGDGYDRPRFRRYHHHHHHHFFREYGYEGRPHYFGFRPHHHHHHWHHHYYGD